LGTSSPENAAAKIDRRTALGDGRMRPARGGALGWQAAAMLSSTNVLVDDADEIEVEFASGWAPPGGRIGQIAAVA